jgi:hypothetical protein
MQCKQCGEALSKNEAHDIWELRRQYVAPVQREGESRQMYLEDAGVFCSRNCLRDYLGAGNKSGIFSLKKPPLAP